MDNINRIMEEGKLVVAGSMGSNEKNYRGIFIFNHIGSLEELEELLQSDPIIQNGIFETEITHSMALPLCRNI